MKMIRVNVYEAVSAVTFNEQVTEPVETLANTALFNTLEEAMAWTTEYAKRNGQTICSFSNGAINLGHVLYERTEDGLRAPSPATRLAYEAGEEALVMIERRAAFVIEETFSCFDLFDAWQDYDRLAKKAEENEKKLTVA